MSEATEGEQFDPKQINFVVEQSKAGAHPDQIVAGLTGMGMDRDSAGRLVTELGATVRTVIAQEQAAGVHVARALVGGLVAALVSGGVWALVCISTGYELGFLALGVGFLAGMAVLFASGGKRGTSMQLVAVGASVLGIFVGKYLMFHHFLVAAITEHQGAEAAASFGLVAPATLELFSEVFSDLLSGYDLLWVALAVMVAWGVPKSSIGTVKAG